MANFKRGKQRPQKGGWGSDSGLHKHERIDEARERNLHKRRRGRSVVVKERDDEDKVS